MRQRLVVRCRFGNKPNFRPPRQSPARRRGWPGCRRVKCAKRTQFHQRAKAPAGEMCETNLGTLGYLGDGTWAKPIVQNKANSRRTTCPMIPMFYCSTVPIRCRLCETNPTPGDAGWGEALGAWDAGESCRTNPIPGDVGWSGAPGTGVAGESRKTKPNLGELGHLGDGARGEPILRNEPNSGQPGWHPAADYAKRTQFPDCGFRIGDWGLGTDLRRVPAASGLRKAKRAKRSQFRRGESRPSWLHTHLSPTRMKADRTKRSQFRPPAVIGGRTLTGRAPRRRLWDVCGPREVRAGRHETSEASERKVSR